MTVKMGVYSLESGKLEDFGEYESIDSALDDAIKFDIPRGRYCVIEDELNGIFERLRTARDVERLRNRLD